MSVSGKPQESIVYVNGEFLPASEARVSVFDHVVLYGDGVYDTMCAWNYGLFKLDEHVERLYESAHAIKLEVPLDKRELKAVILETVRRNDLRNAYVKVIATRGVGAQPLMSPYNCTPGLIVFAVPYMSLVGSAQDRGIKMMVSSLRRIPDECLSSKIKSCNYLNHILMRMEANEAGADDAIELDMEGYVCEAPGYNVFMVKKGVIYTPIDHILLGVTRQTVIELAEAASIPVQERRIQPFDLYNADEMFLSSTAGGIFAVGELDGRMIGNGKPGPLTKMMGNAYLALLESGEKSTPVGR
ncbi:MAG: branched-chain-amino-acid transaminase [Chloroflexota bacterium]